MPVLGLKNNYNLAEKEIAENGIGKATIALDTTIARSVANGTNIDLITRNGRKGSVTGKDISPLPLIENGVRNVFVIMLDKFLRIKNTTKPVTKPATLTNHVSISNKLPESRTRIDVCPKNPARIFGINETKVNATGTATPKVNNKDSILKIIFNIFKPGFLRIREDTGKLDSLFFSSDAADSNFILADVAQDFT
ncbi:hypothetical protein TMatcc_006339 [Talaromyces marneffei ATCC 18224]